ncbi:MAG: V-type ATPase 116kDa subunit family protein [Syntrophobacterales bacterium]|jgi:V/A-type H+-transporting ATPase subunit I
MFRPVPMVLINLQVDEEDISRATAVLTKLRIMHLINLVETPLGKLGYMGHLERDLLARYERAGEEVDRWAQALGLTPQVFDVPADLDPAKDIYRLEDSLERIPQSVGPVVQRLQEGKDRLAILQRHQENLRYLLPTGIDLQALTQLQFTHLVPGLVPTENLDKLEEALAHLHHALIPVTSVGEQTVILAASLDKDRDALDQALKGAFFEIMELPRQASGTVEEALISLTSQVADLQDTLARLQAQCDHLKEELGPELGRLRNRIDLTRTLLRARVLFGKVNHAYLISGWIPAALVDKLKEDLAAELGDRALVEVLSPETVPGIREGTLKIPILFNNPFLIRPFERLTRAYGTPGYGEVEPTPFLALGFLVMFGLMFGDLGQGAVLVGLGYLILRRFLRYTDYGIILMECGVSSMVFGLLYGSFFGIEGLLPVLWFSPLKNINYFMKISLLIGVGIISLGLILSFINAVRLKKRRLPAAQLLAALFYWILAALGLRYLMTGALVWDYWVSLVVGAVSLVLLSLFILQRLRVKPEKARPQAEGRGLHLLEGAIEVVDGTVRYVANTISFIRIAAFALAHAGLFIAVFSLAETLGRLQGGGILYWLTVALGNVVIILLEGLVVSIQTVRLEYYEFLSKFFHGGGEQFTPLERKAISS